MLIVDAAYSATE